MRVASDCIGRLLGRLKKPELFYQPRLLVRRLIRLRPPRPARIRLPWGLWINVDVEDQIVHSIRSLGLHELVVCEVLWRLMEGTSIGIDVGAHVGHMTSLMAARVGSTGRVIAIEPHPRLAALLRKSAAEWAAPVETVEAAASNAKGSLSLVPPAPYELNSGTSFVGSGAGTLTVAAVTLDGTLGSLEHSAVLKIDAEGHEAEVLSGAAGLLRTRKIRDVIFEDHHPFPSPAMQMLESSGYRLFQLGRGFTRPHLARVPPGCATMPWEAPNYLATVEPERAVRLMSRRGWQVFGEAPRE